MEQLFYRILKRHYIAVLLILVAPELFGCICKTISKKEQYQKSEIVSLGTVRNVTEKGYDFEFLEIFKGDRQEKTILVEYSGCSLYPLENETWLLYLNTSKENNNWYATECGWARSTEFPFALGGGLYANAPEKLQSDSMCSQEFEAMVFSFAKRELENDLSHYRNYNQSDSSHEPTQLAEKPEYNFNSKREFGFFAFGVVLSSFIFLVWRRFR